MAQNDPQSTKASRHAAEAKPLPAAVEARLAAAVEAAYILESRTR